MATASNTITINTFNEKKYTPLIVAIQNVNLGEVTRLLAMDEINPNLKHEEETYYPLMWACGNYPGKFDIFKALLAHPKIDASLREPKFGYCALGEAVTHNLHENVKLILAHPTLMGLVTREVNYHKFGRTVMSTASNYGHHETIAVLLSVPGFDVKFSSENFSKETYLYGAIRSNSLKSVKLLVEGGVDMTNVNKEGKTALNVAKELALLAKSNNGRAYDTDMVPYLESVIGH